MNEILKVVLFSSLSYLTLFIISKLLGKKQIAELDFIDYVTGISIGSIAAEMATETNKPFFYYLIAMVIFFIFDFIVTILARKTNFLKRFLRGSPIIIINKGKVDFKALKKSKIDFYDLLGMSRDKGYFDLSQIEYAIFETNGDLSLMPKDKYRPLKREDFSIKSSETMLTSYLVVDGEISDFALKVNNLTKSWLKEEIKKRKIKLKKILYATLKNDKLEIELK